MTAPEDPRSDLPGPDLPGPDLPGPDQPVPDQPVPDQPGDAGAAPAAPVASSEPAASPPRVAAGDPLLGLSGPRPPAATQDPPAPAQDPAPSAAAPATDEAAPPAPVAAAAVPSVPVDPVPAAPGPDRDAHRADHLQDDPDDGRGAVPGLPLAAAAGVALAASGPPAQPPYSAAADRPVDEPTGPRDELAAGPDRGRDLHPDPGPDAGSDPGRDPDPAHGGNGTLAGDPDAAPAGRRNLVALTAACLIVALLAAGTAFLGLRLLDARATERAREEATAASRDAARLLFSYDHTTLDQDFERGLAVTTGAFREEYTRTTKEVVADVAREYKAVVLADVVESSVVAASPDEVTTLVFLNQATTSTRVQGQQVDASRVRMTLVQRDGRWLVSRVQAL